MEYQKIIIVDAVATEELRKFQKIHNKILRESYK